MAYTITSYDVVKAFNTNQQVTGSPALSWSYDPGTSGTNLTCVRTKTGNKLHNYKKVIARGSNATTSFSGSISEYSSEPSLENVFGSTVTGGNSAGWRKQASKWSHGIFSIPTIPSNANDVAADNIASTKFYKALESTMTAFQGGVFLVELRETLHMIRHPAQSLRKKISEYSDYLGANRGRMMRRPKSARLKWLADTWLERSFGWVPLLNDLNSARTTLDRRQNQLARELIPIIGVGEIKSVSFAELGYFVGVANMITENRYSSSTMRVYAGAVHSTAAGNTLLNMNALGMSPRSFVPTLWEALPWSFMIDYFTNVGDVISAWSNQTTGLAWGRTTLRKLSSAESGGCYNKPRSTLVQVFDRSLYTGKTIARNRSVVRGSIGTVPIPAIQFELPGFGTKWINISALIASRSKLRFL